MNSQRFFAVARQVLALLGIVFAILTASISQLHLPVAVSVWLGIGGTILLAVEHYVSDPSTGTAPPPYVPPTPPGLVPSTNVTPPGA